jgi:hypothetical protein
MQIIATSGANTFTFDDLSTGVVIQSFEGFEYPSVRQIIDDYVGRDGAQFLDSKFGRRALAWSGEFLGGNNANMWKLRRDFLNVIKQGAMVNLKFTTYDGIPLQVDGIVAKFVAPYSMSVNAYMVEVICPDWRFSGQSLLEVNTGTVDFVGGETIPATLPSTLVVGSTTLTSATNPGNERSTPVFRIYGPGTNFTVQNATTGKLFLLSFTLQTGEWVDVDVQARTVKLGANQNAFYSFSGDWIELEPGTNELRFNAQTGGDENTLLVVSYFDAYRGI